MSSLSGGGHRVHDPRLGRFLSIDPLSPEYPHNSPYAFSENRVVDAVELEGLEAAHVISGILELKNSRGVSLLDDVWVFKKSKQAHLKIKQPAPPRETKWRFLPFKATSVVVAMLISPLTAGEGSSTTPDNEYRLIELRYEYDLERERIESIILDEEWSKKSLNEKIQILEGARSLSSYEEDLLDLLRAQKFYGYLEAKYSNSKWNDHHIVPKALRVSKTQQNDCISGCFGKGNKTEYEDSWNMLELPTELHGYHPQYNEYVIGEWELFLEFQLVQPEECECDQIKDLLRDFADEKRKELMEEILKNPNKRINDI